jgi:cytochrome c553
MLDRHKRKAFDAIVWTSSLLVAAVLPLAASADSQRYANENPSYRAECGSCHVAYPPALLGPDAWRTVMNELDRHFGTDASVGEARRSELTAYLIASAGTRKGSDAPRITEARWFRREHHEIATATWRARAVKSAANCEACHRRAAAGDFSERTVRIPPEATR